MYRYASEQDLVRAARQLREERQMREAADGKASEAEKLVAKLADVKARYVQKSAEHDDALNRAKAGLLVQVECS